ncbi:MarR family transcriptional regulator [Rhizobium sp. Pop5]|uniref:MarR family winged helix-turn-helix transcriptional regulator n=1 Tax=Rhizobium sp. Pop5 TaxID=1223565 RepID=UPI00028397D2|nr:MarR family transcriptional regulator [Rhizobium sp. Pop5]EJZ21987.1 MarR family transcriptional regulator [Rhizobium sp. Pop5]UVD56830.1 MarR family transcriptional regulator [Rhizobium sp. Pop5]
MEKVPPVAQEESASVMSKRSDSWLKLIHVVANIEADLGKVLQERHGLGLSDYRALEILSRSPDSELRMQELALHLQLNQSSISRMVERLERGGLSVRDLCPDDKRGVYTVLTDKGRLRLESAQPDYEAALTVALKEHGCEGLLSTKLTDTR